MFFLINFLKISTSHLALSKCTNLMVQVKQVKDPRAIFKIVTLRSPIIRPGRSRLLGFEKWRLFPKIQ